MTKTKWHSKLLSLSVAFALIFSLVAMVVPVSTVEAQPYYGVNVTTEDDTYCCCDVFNVTAAIGPVSQNQTDVSAVLTITSADDAELESGSLTVSVGNITAGNTGIATWSVHCTGEGDTVFSVNATSVEYPGGVIGTKTVAQEQCGSLVVVMIDLLEAEEPLIIPVGSTFALDFRVKNTGPVSLNGLFVNVVLIGDNMERAKDGATTWTKLITEDLAPGETTATLYETIIRCTATGPGRVHIEPYGENNCGSEIVGTSEVVRVEQVFGVTCNVTDTKVGHNATFTGTTTGANPPIAYNWTIWNDVPEIVGTINGTTSASTFSDQFLFTEVGNYTACVNVTDNSGITVQCNSCPVEFEVYPALNVTAWLRTGTVAVLNATAERYGAKTDAPVCFNATRIGGFPESVLTALGYNYTWAWDFGDAFNSTSAEQNPCFTYNTTGNYTATVTLSDDYMFNVATDNVTVEIYDPLGISCNATPLDTKASSNPRDKVTFNATLIGGLPTPPVTYSWKWDFGDGSAPFTCGPNTTHQYTTGGNFTAVVEVWDGTAINNTATCNKTIHVWPSLNVTCDVTPDPQNVCHSVNFTAEREGGVPGNAYNWTWEFMNADTHAVVGTAVGQNVTWTFMCVGNYTGTVTITDTVLGNTANCTSSVEIIIEAPELYTPGNGVTVGSSTVDFTWEDIGCCNYTLEIWQKDGLECKVWLVDTGKDAFWSGPIMDGNYKWQVTATDSCGNSAVSELWYFGVQESAIAVTVTSPNGGEVLSANGTAAITWNAAYTDRYSGGFASSQDDLLAEISYSADAGATWTTVATDEPNDGVYAWTVPMVSSELCLVMVSVSDGAYNDGVDTSNGVFTIKMASAPVSSIDLAAGWNLISLPLIPSNTATAAVMSGVSGNVTVVYYYNAAATIPGWLSWTPSGGGTLTTMEDGKGYWIYMATAGTFTFSGNPMPTPPALPPTYDVVAGWNMIGVKSTTPVIHSNYLVNLAGDYSVLYAYDAATGVWLSLYPMEQNGGMMEPGSGFWIYMGVDGIIVP